MLYIACHMVLLGLHADSTSFHLADQEVRNSHQAEQLVQNFVKTKCEGQVEVQKTQCRKVVNSDPTTQVCYIATNIGYFFVTNDMLGNVNLTFNRWD